MSKRNSVDVSNSSNSSPTNSNGGYKDKDSSAGESTTPTKKGISLTQTLNSIRRSSKSNGTSNINNSLKKSDKAAIQEELKGMFSIDSAIRVSVL